MGASDPIQEATALIEPTVHELGYELVRVHMTGGGRPTLQVMAERLDREAMTVEDCAEISRAVSALLDVHDPVRGSYTLEVSSPGLNRPLVRPADYDRFRGSLARVETHEAIEGRKRFKGRLLGREDSSIRIETESGEIVIPLEAIRRARLLEDIEQPGTRRQAG